MSFRKPLDLTFILRTLFFTVPFLLVLNSIIFYRNIKGTEKIENEVRMKRESVFAVGRVIYKLKDAESYQKDYLLSGRPGDLQNFKASEVRVREALGILRSQAPGNVDLSSRMDEVETKLEKTLQGYESRIDNRLTGKGGQLSNLSARQNVEADQLHDLAQELMIAETNLMEDYDRESRRSRDALVISIMALTSLDIILLVLTFLIWRRDRNRRQLGMETKSRFLANMSHEIRTPLGVIAGFIDLALAPDSPPEEKPKYLLRIRHNTELLGRLVDDILDLSKVEAGKLDIETIDFSLTALLEEIEENFLLKARQKKLHFGVKSETALPAFIKTDPNRLRQILTNLVNNAIKFTENGSVFLKVSSYPAENGHFDLNFKVEDTGVGISLKQRDRLFNPFCQAEASTARRFGGTGLGLVLSKRLAELLGGRLRLVSTVPGHGSIFELELCVEEGKVSVTDLIVRNLKTSKKFKPIGSNRLQGVRILLVEDAIDNQALVKIVLGMNGAEVICVSDAASGIEKANSDSNFQLVLMDIQMPGMNGFEATQVLRSQNFQKPIVALTAHAMKEERDRALQMGFDDYVTKPIDRAELIAVIEKHTCIASGFRPEAPNNP